MSPSLVITVLSLAMIAASAHAAERPQVWKDRYSLDLVYRGATRNVYHDVGAGNLTRIVSGDTGRFEIQLEGQVDDPETDNVHPIEARGRYLLERITAHVVKEKIEVPPFSGIGADELATYRERLRKALPGLHLATLPGDDKRSFMALGALLQLESKQVGGRREITVSEAGDSLLKLFFDVEAGGALRLTRFDFPLPKRKINLVFRFP